MAEFYVTCADYNEFICPSTCKHIKETGMWSNLKGFTCCAIDRSSQLHNSMHNAECFHGGSDVKGLRKYALAICAQYKYMKRERGVDYDFRGN